MVSSPFRRSLRARSCPVRGMYINYMIIINISDKFHHVSVCSHIYRKRSDGDMGYVPLQRPLSRWAKLWLTLAARASCNSVEAVSRSSQWKRRNDVTAEQLLSEISDYCR